MSGQRCDREFDSTQTKARSSIVDDSFGPFVRFQDYERLRRLVKELVDYLPPCPTCDAGTTTKKTCGYSRALVKVTKELGE